MLKIVVKISLIISCTSIVVLLLFALLLPNSGDNDGTGSINSLVSYNSDNTTELPLDKGNEGVALDNTVSTNDTSSEVNNEPDLDSQQVRQESSSGIGNQTNNQTDNESQPQKPAVLSCGQPGGTCTQNDVAGFSSSTNCRTAINAIGNGMAVYVLPSSFLSLHQSEKNITEKLCGKTYTENLQTAEGKHRNGSELGGNNYSTWIANFYLGPYSP